VFGIDPEAAMADPRVVVRAVHPEDRERYLAAIEASRRTRTALDHRHRIVTEGGIVWARVLGRPRVAGAGRVVWDGITIDETERMAAEEALRESRALQEIAGRTARVGGWVADLARDRISLSDEVCAIHGLPRGTTLRLNEGADYYARGWRERIRSAFRACARHATAFDEEAELLTAGGDRLWVRVIGEAVREDSGRVTQVRGALQDITEHKATREEARRLAERLTTTLESITDAFFTLDPEWRFTYINREAERVMARSRDDLLGRNMWQEYPDLRGTRVEQEYAQAIEARRTAEFEFYYPAWETWFEIHAYPSEEGLAIYFRDVTERKRAQAEIEFLALYDPLTHLPNRRLLMDRLGQAIAANARTGQHGAMLFLDLDHFKTVNDTLGHDAGDEMLKEASRRLGQCVRATDTVARFGGDEFAVVLQDLGADAAGAADQAQRIGDGMREGLARPYQLGQHERYTTVSVGVTLFGGHADDDAEDAMKRADLAMYEAKSAGRSALRVFHPSMRTAVQSRVNLESQLRRALREDRIRPHFQPQVDHTGRLIGAEALARWEQSDGDHVSPAEFIPVAEQSGLILQLGAAMLERVCERLAAWKRHPGLADVGVSVNVSAHQFHHPGFVDTVRAVLDRTGAVPGQLWLELTESLLLVDIEDTIDKMHALRDLGVRFTLDDFGTGYSSLAYLKRLPLDQLKIDQGFVRDALTDANDDAIVRTIVVLAQTLGLQVIAEGVETEALRDRLAAHGCTLYQGYLFGRPMSPLALEALARSHVAG
jgi:diguanylate cyclase (GGDEF)-like protein/PAS domain S-box-containing protein